MLIYRRTIYRHFIYRHFIYRRSTYRRSTLRCAQGRLYRRFISAYTSAGSGICSLCTASHSSNVCSADSASA
jgi:hypothetical protein